MDSRRRSHHDHRRSHVVDGETSNNQWQYHSVSSHCSAKLVTPPKYPRFPIPSMMELTKISLLTGIADGFACCSSDMSQMSGLALDSLFSFGANTSFLGSTRSSRSRTSALSWPRRNRWWCGYYGLRILQTRSPLRQGYDSHTLRWIQRSIGLRLARFLTGRRKNGIECIHRTAANV